MIDSILIHYASGLSTMECAIRFKISRRQVRKILLSSGVKMRSSSRKGIKNKNLKSLV